jgi:Galactose oxidase, central domain/Eukaryotic cytochrome b561
VRHNLQLLASPVLPMSRSIWSHRCFLLVAIFHECLDLNFAQRFQLEKLIPATGPLPLPRFSSSFTSFSDGESVLLFGGRTEDEALDDTWIYSASTNGWTFIGNTGPSPRYETLSVAVDYGGVDGKYIYVIGGRDSISVLQSSLVWAFQLSSRSWNEITLNATTESSDDVANAFARASAVGGVTTDNKLLISHGTAISELKSDAFLVSLSTGSATVEERVYQSIRTYNIGNPRTHTASAFCITPANELVISGGCNWPGLCPHPDSYGYDLTSKGWRYLSRGPTARQFASMAVALPSMQGASIDPRQNVILWGGLEKSKQTFGSDEVSPLEVDLLDVHGRKWSRELAESSADSIGKRYAANLVVVGTGLPGNDFRYIVFGGRSVDSGEATNELLVLSFDANKPEKVVSSRAARSHSYLYVHGIVMFTTFAGLLPLAVFIARYMRSFSSSPHWFLLHSGTQILAGLLAWVGVAFSIYGAHDSPTHVHAITGIVVMTLFTSQLIAALAVRPNPNAGFQRRVWSSLHQFVGWIVSTLGLLNCLSGLLLVNSRVGLWGSFVVVTFTLLFVALVLELRRLSRRDHKDSRYVKEDFASVSFEGKT